MSCYSAEFKEANEAPAVKQGKEQMTGSTFSKDIGLDWEALMNCISRKGTPERVHFLELFLDPEDSRISATDVKLHHGRAAPGSYIAHVHVT